MEWRWAAEYDGVKFRINESGLEVQGMGRDLTFLREAPGRLFVAPNEQTKLDIRKSGQNIEMGTRDRALSDHGNFHWDPPSCGLRYFAASDEKQLVLSPIW
jgi:hypothetical protein